MEQIDPYNVMPTKCGTCVLHPDMEKRFKLTPERISEIKLNAIEGVNQICHCNKDGEVKICRGVRDYMVDMWHRLGRIEEPTEECLLKTMEYEINRRPDSVDSD